MVETSLWPFETAWQSSYYKIFATLEYCSSWTIVLPPQRTFFTSAYFLLTHFTHPDLHFPYPLPLQLDIPSVFSVSFHHSHFNSTRPQFSIENHALLNTVSRRWWRRRRRWRRRRKLFFLFKWFHSFSFVILGLNVAVLSFIVFSFWVWLWLF